ncbi:LruC domain-containing protein [Pedobacter alpinus]|uniref:LruC domain-containing protein n=1 Tax=Pedobacter alpinus TaxID=1590643 RepID=A0ABW5TR53_9SPHI
MRKLILGLFIIASIVACKKDNTGIYEEINNSDNIAPNGFNFATTKTVKINIRLLTNINEPIAKIPVTLYNAANGNQLLKSLTDSEGRIDVSLNIASYIDQIIVKNDYVGLNNKVLGFIDNNSLNLTIGGGKGLEGNFIIPALNKNTSNRVSTQSVKTLSGTLFTYMGAFESNGKPKYLTPDKGKVSAQLLSYINASIPSTVDVRTNHPEYMADDAKQTLDLVKDADVFLTFVTESAELTNTVAFYTYPTNNPPKNASEINEIKFAFPNSSFIGSGGGLISGDRVNLGNFKAGTSVAFMIIADGWDISNETVKTDRTKFYSNKNFNPESDQDLKKHTVLLNFAQEDLFVLGIEDVNRESPFCDHDINDALFYAESFPKDAISKTGIVNLDTPKDTDGDGVTDQFDEYPTDPKKAYNNYFPSKDSWGTLAFEDNWPLKGDYDMNDLVINYRYTYVTNANNNAVEMNADYKVLTSLAFFQNGFGVELPFSPSIIDNVSGYIKEKNYIKLNANGTEAGQDKAVIIPFDNQKSIYNAANGVSEQVSMVIKFIAPQPINILSNAPYNPFLISDGRRSHEIHLPGKTPTNLADKALFGFQDDLSNPSAGRYYIGTNNWPWALQFTEPFNPPAEGIAIDQVYSKFGAWASSGGSSFTDWYKNLGK